MLRRATFRGTDRPCNIHLTLWHSGLPSKISPQMWGCHIPFSASGASVNRSHFSIGGQSRTRPDAGASRALPAPTWLSSAGPCHESNSVHDRLHGRCVCGCRVGWVAQLTVLPFVLACDTCGALPIAIKPGDASETCELMGHVLILKAGRPTLQWCRAHYPNITTTKGT